MKQILIAAAALTMLAGAASAEQRCYVGSTNGRINQNDARIACDQVRGGGRNILIELGFGIIKFGPATYDQCVDWVNANED